MNFIFLWVIMKNIMVLLIICTLTSCMTNRGDVNYEPPLFHDSECERLIRHWNYTFPDYPCEETDY